MVKKILIIIALTIITTATPSKTLKELCLNCHIKQQIPSELIYRRYLMKYSTNNNIKKRVLSYLKNPKRETSIMPKQFFLKFTIKKKLDINDTLLNSGIDKYLRYFDVRDRFGLE